MGWAASSGWQCRTRPSGDDVAVTKRERIDRDVLLRRAPAAVLSGVAAGDDVRDLMAAAAPSHVPGTHGKHVLRAARDLAEAGGEDGPEVAHSRAEITRLRAHTA